jgi:hypothetical protein
MTQDEILKEIKKCKENPYYFATKYLMMKNHKKEKVKFTTFLREKDFNQMFLNYENTR